MPILNDIFNCYKKSIIKKIFISQWNNGLINLFLVNVYLNKFSVQMMILIFFHNIIIVREMPFFLFFLLLAVNLFLLCCFAIKIDCFVFEFFRRTSSSQQQKNIYIDHLSRIETSLTSSTANIRSKIFAKMMF